MEKISSLKTSLLFIMLAIGFLCLSLWHTSFLTNWNPLGSIFLFFFCLFIFYIFNYHTLIIHITASYLHLRFGIFTCKMLINSIKEVQLDKIPTFMKYGGAGIHFMFVKKRYRASYNFLEYPRICVSLKKRKGLVEDVSFSTRDPKKIMRTLNKLMKI